mmetsp:Transcript_9112/g.28915  ORF Transcript_9112/g.28915 Transcript_9112/m.28915 type:complete len:160 (-) Transcript_9112:746-1225(-)
MEHTHILVVNSVDDDADIDDAIDPYEPILVHGLDRGRFDMLYEPKTTDEFAANGGSAKDLHYVLQRIFMSLGSSGLENAQQLYNKETFNPTVRVPRVLIELEKQGLYLHHADQDADLGEMLLNTHDIDVTDEEPSLSETSHEHSHASFNPDNLFERTSD